jgi:hypothetical protein
MVTDKDEMRNTPEYSIQRIRELAASGHVRYMSTTVERDVQNLEYIPDDVHECLARLDKSHYYNSIRYAGRKYWLDVYHITCQGQTAFQDNLYIKLKLDRDCIWIDLASFHRERQ